jgi:hypothetical protein
MACTNQKTYVESRFKTYDRDQIIITSHATIRLLQRQISEDEIMENILNPKRLEYAIKEKHDVALEEKFDCYFGYSKTLCHRYIVVLKDDVVVVTVVKINRRWQAIVENKLKTG